MPYVQLSQADGGHASHSAGGDGEGGGEGGGGDGGGGDGGGVGGGEGGGGDQSCSYVSSVNHSAGFMVGIRSEQAHVSPSPLSPQSGAELPGLFASPDQVRMVVDGWNAS
jgi:hypothetical protein